MSKTLEELKTSIEPEGELFFDTDRELRSHVERHCLNFSEQWDRFFSRDLILFASAVEHDHPAFVELSEMYEKFLSDIVNKYCAIGTQHLHFTEKQIKKPLSQVVEVWEFGKQIKVVVKTSVRKGKISPYVLCTGYRNYKRFTETEFRREVEKRLNEPSYIKDRGTPKEAKTTLIADHSGFATQTK